MKTFKKGLLLLSCMIALSLRAETAYEVLGVSEDATEKEITTAYRKLSLKVHPDRGGSNEEFVKLTAAYNSLILQAVKSEVSPEVTKAITGNNDLKNQIFQTMGGLTSSQIKDATTNPKKKNDIAKKMTKHLTTITATIGKYQTAINAALAALRITLAKTVPSLKNTESVDYIIFDKIMTVIADVVVLCKNYKNAENDDERDEATQEMQTSVLSLFDLFSLI